MPQNEPSMLETLRRIVQDVDSAPSFQAALEILVRSVRDATHTEVCSVYLLDDRTERLVLMATEGLNANAIGMVSLAFDEGLVGLCATREEPINLQDAPNHPRYRYFPETGEEHYNAFVAVPIMNRRKVLGVLVVQQRTNRRFDEGEVAFLVTLSAQLSGVVAHAKVMGQLEMVRGSRTTQTQIYQGIMGAAGVTLGRAVVLYPPADLEQVPDRSVEDLEHELEFLARAIEEVRADVRALDDRMSGTLMPEERALFDVYLRMLDDHALPSEIAERIEAGNWAQGALREVIDEHMQNFAMMDDPYLRERMSDVRDLGLRILAKLQDSETEDTREFPDNSILIGEDISTAMLLEVPLDKVSGVVSATGAANSHMAIVARALGIPTVVGVSDLPVTSLDDAEMIVDAYLGRLFVQPSRALRKRYKDIIKEEQQLVAGLDAYKQKEAITPDGHVVALCVNTGLMADVARAKDRGAEGVGLYRSEIPFMLRERFPGEEEQRQIYRQQLEAFAPKPVTMRTLDIGGDKDLPYFPIREDNPALGWRGVRITLDHPEIFMVQVRAMLKASSGLDNLNILLPMVTTVSEVEDSVALIHRAVEELREEGEFDIRLPRIGIMVEVPAAVIQIADLAKRVDFVSIGSNDLTQYLLAVDRNNSRVADLYSPYHPAVLRAVRYVVNEAHRVGKPVSICGEMAGDPGTAILLMAMGFDTLSMSASNLLKVRKTICHTPMALAKDLLEQLLELDRPQDIRDEVEKVLSALGLHNLTRARSES
ncbi:MAG: phosphoenolpyruvate--protein phosphotransferase [Moraxellaceae bacterium]|nr:phosphoenolpyruvate--protein phosphotransferase [Moraxellaceae bacterium]MDZ4297024.1 phosphoenolpyruvate--protein phosphotransferase [Moraxellaceae bacterium]MDZ4386532.1 phosphoenolpyruvate--protein phosphotransferase [Moraxellaceae bacterium]